MNFHDSERASGLLESRGYEHTDDERQADVFVINTCSVREHAAEKLYTRWGEIRGIAAERPGKHDKPVVAVTGCVAQQEGARLFAHGRGVDVIAGTQSLKQLPDLIEAAAAAHPLATGRQRID